jgi:RNA polymerase sigma-70 factor, ECF subfamily
MDASQAAAPVLPDAEPERRVAAMVAKHHIQVWRSLRRLGVSECDADDATQQVFLVAHRRLADIAPEHEQSFLLQTPPRVAAEFRRSRRRRREDDDEYLPILADTAASPEELADMRRACAMLDRALEAMPMDLRKVFVFFYLEELTTAEVSSVLHVPKGKCTRPRWKPSMGSQTLPRGFAAGQAGRLRRRPFPGRRNQGIGPPGLLDCSERMHHSDGNLGAGTCLRRVPRLPARSARGVVRARRGPA